MLSMKLYRGSETASLYIFYRGSLNIYYLVDLITACNEDKTCNQNALSYFSKAVVVHCFANYILFTVHIHTHKQEHTNIHTQTHTQKHINTQKPTLTHTHTNTQKHTLTHTQTHKYTHKHTQNRMSKNEQSSQNTTIQHATPSELQLYNHKHHLTVSLYSHSFSQCYLHNNSH